MAVVVWWTLSWSACVARAARSSLRKPSRTLAARIAPITAASLTSPSAPASTAVTMSRIINALLNWLSRISNGCTRTVRSAFGPSCSRRAVASLALSPVREVRSACSTSSTERHSGFLTVLAGGISLHPRRCTPRQAHQSTTHDQKATTGCAPGTGAKVTVRGRAARVRRTACACIRRSTVPDAPASVHVRQSMPLLRRVLLHEPPRPRRRIRGGSRRNE